MMLALTQSYRSEKYKIFFRGMMAVTETAARQLKTILTPNPPKKTFFRNFEISKLFAPHIGQNIFNKHILPFSFNQRNKKNVAMFFIYLLEYGKSARVNIPVHIFE